MFRCRNLSGCGRLLGNYFNAKMLTTGLPSIREMLNEDAHDGTLEGLVIFKNTGRDLLDGISKANKLCFTFWGDACRACRPDGPLRRC
jgi:hypothetical protein